MHWTTYYNDILVKKGEINRYQSGDTFRDVQWRRKVPKSVCVGGGGGGGHTDK